MLTYEHASGRNDVEEFLHGLSETDRAQMVALIHRAANHGPPYQNRERCLRLKGEDFSEFKTHDRRVLWFMHAGKIILMTGFEKKQPRTPRGELTRGRNTLSAIREELR